MSRSGLDVTFEFGIDALDGNHFRELISPEVHHRDVVIRPLPRRHQALVLKVTITGVRPHRRDLGRNLEIPLLHQSRPFHPQTGNELCVRSQGAHDLHLIGDRFGDQFAQGFVVAAYTWIKRGVTDIGESTQAHGPHHFLIGGISSGGVLPGALENLRVAGIGVRDILWPARDIEA